MKFQKGNIVRLVRPVLDDITNKVFSTGREGRIVGTYASQKEDIYFTKFGDDVICTIDDDLELVKET